MPDVRTTVVRFDHFSNALFETYFAASPKIELVTVSQSDEPAARAAMARAHVYQVTSTKDELLAHWHVKSALLERMPNLLCVSTSGAGFDTVDVADCTAAGVIVVNQSGGNARAVAEHTIGMMLDLVKRISETDRALRTHRGFTREDVMGHEMSGRTLGLVGLGNVGRRVAALARAFDMPVLACDPNLDATECAHRGAEKVTLDELLARADFVSLHCPRDKTTIGMIGKDQFARMKKGAIFLTTARGGITDEAALLAALKSGHVAGAGVDVWDVEPPPLGHPLLKLENVIATYHTAGVTHEARVKMAEFAATQVIDVLAGKRPPRLVNPEVWPKYTKRFETILGRKVEA